MPHLSNTNSRLKEVKLVAQLAAQKKRQLLDRICASSSNTLLKKLGLAQVRGLHINCGTGSLSLAILDQLNPNCELVAIDQDEDLIKLARQNTRLPTAAKVEFLTEMAFLQENPETFDFLYLHYPFYSSSHFSRADHLFQLLNPGGHLFIYSLHWTKMNGFPQELSFQRFKALLSTFQKSAPLQGFTELNLQRAGFASIILSFQPPLFLKENDRELASLSLKTIAPSLLQMELTNITDLRELLTALIAFEHKTRTIINLPEVYHLSARKPP